METLIHKQVLPNTEANLVFTLELPINARLLDIQFQHGTPVIWYEFNASYSDIPFQRREFVNMFTGHPFRHNGHFRLGHVKTYQRADGLIIHLMELIHE